MGNLNNGVIKQFIKLNDDDLFEILNAMHAHEFRALVGTFIDNHHEEISDHPLVEAAQLDDEELSDFINLMGLEEFRSLVRTLGE